MSKKGWLDSNKNKAAQLGMSWGMAGHILRRNLFFSLMQATNRDICIRCGLIIKEAKDFSIDHIKPWYGEDNSLFWDLGNVGFSHKRCNKRDRKTQPSNKIICPTGMAWCAKCKDFKVIGDFHKRRRRWNGVSNYCKGCKKGVNHWRVVKKQKSLPV